MIRKVFLLVFFTSLFHVMTQAQAFVSTSDLFKRSGQPAGQLNINQDPAIDTLLSKYILLNKKNSERYGYGYYGMDGYRIQIYRSSNRNAREESKNANAVFLDKFPNIISYPLYSEPGWFMIRVGDFRSKAEATKLFLSISKVFPGAYVVPDLINFPDLNKK